MTGSEPGSERLQQLKDRAQAISQQHGDTQALDLTSIEVAKLLEDLRIYQIELELQNEELRTAQQSLGVSRRRYQSLFEQMPLPALVVAAQGLIEECNERASTLLGERKTQGGPDNRLFQGLSRDDRTRLHVALRDVRHGEPLVLHKLALGLKQNSALH